LGWKIYFSTFFRKTKLECKNPYLKRNTFAILSVRRGGENIITHGYTRLRLHDIVTVLGKPEDIEQTRFKLQF